MRDVRTKLSSLSFAILFAAVVVLSGCAGNLTGPQPQAAPEKATVQAELPGAVTNGDGTTTPSASPNSCEDCTDDDPE